VPITFVRKTTSFHELEDRRTKRKTDMERKFYQVIRILGQCMNPSYIICSSIFTCLVLSQIDPKNARTSFASMNDFGVGGRWSAWSFIQLSFSMLCTQSLCNSYNAFTIKSTAIDNCTGTNIKQSYISVLKHFPRNKFTIKKIFSEVHTIKKNGLFHMSKHQRIKFSLIQEPSTTTTRCTGKKGIFSPFLMQSEDTWLWISLLWNRGNRANLHNAKT